MLFSIFSKITRRDTLTQKIETGAAGVYLYILFPITVTFILTFITARIISRLDPRFFIHIVPNLHIHHFAYGIILMTVSGYLALVNESPKIRYLVALLYGIALGLTFDEFGFWLKLSDSNSARWSYDGAVVLGALFILMLSAESGIRMWQKHFSRKQLEIEAVSALEKTILEPPATT